MRLHPHFLSLFGVLGLTLSLSACIDGTWQTTDPQTPDVSGDMVDMADTMPDAQVPVIPVGPLAGRSDMRLLTRYEYDNTVSSLFGRPLGQSEDKNFPSENLVGWFENDSGSHKVSPLLIRKYMEASEAIAQDVLAIDRAQVLSCDESTQTPEVCARTLLEDLLPRAFRRPATQPEIDAFLARFDAALALHGYDIALEMTLGAILQSPQFLYRIELREQSMPGEGPLDGGMVAEEVELVGPYEMANRLSYFLWASMPDDALFEAAQRGELSTVEQIEAQVERMLPDPKTAQMVREFHRQWLGLQGLNSIVKSTSFYPKWDASLRQDWRESLDLFIDHVFWEKGDFASFMTSPVVYLTQDLARLYNVTPPEGEEGVFAHDADAKERFGIMTQPALLALLANSNQSSPILRGVFIRERLLCQHIGAPPDDAELTPPDPDPNATTREIFAEHTTNPTCASCHVLIDPLGFGFEHYDGVGHYRTTENNYPVDASGMLTSVGDPDVLGSFKDASELMNRLSQSPLVPSCMSKQWLQFALGRSIDSSDKPSQQAINTAFAASGWRWDAMFRAIVISDSFRYRTIQE